MPRYRLQLTVREIDPESLRPVRTDVVDLAAQLDIEAADEQTAIAQLPAELETIPLEYGFPGSSQLA